MCNIDIVTSSLHVATTTTVCAVIAELAPWTGLLNAVILVILAELDPSVDCKTFHILCVQA